MLSSPLEVKGVEMNKQRKVMKVSHRNPHGDSSRSVGLKGFNDAELKVFKRLEKRPVLFPVTRAPNGRVLSAAVTVVVGARK